MGANTISWRRLQQVNRTYGERFVHATTYSHHEWWWWHCIRHNGSSAHYNTRTGELREHEEPSDTTTTVLLKNRKPRFPHEAEWLGTLDERAKLLEAKRP